MNNYNEIWQLPEVNLLNKRLTKAFFQRNFELTSAEKKVVNDTIKNMDWLAKLSPSLSNIPPYQNNQISFDEIQFFTCQVNNVKADAQKVIDLFQKHIPFHQILIIEDADHFIINTATKRINQNETNKRVIEQLISSPIILKIMENEQTKQFLEQLKFVNLNKTNLQTTHQNIVNTIVNYQISVKTNTLPQRAFRTQEDMENLYLIEQTEKEIITLSNQIKKEKQTAKQIELNIAIKQKRNYIEQLKNKLN